MFWVNTSSPTGWTCLKNLQWKSPRRQPSQTPGQTSLWMYELHIKLSPATLMRKLISAASICKRILILYPELMVAGECYWLNSFFTTAVGDSTTFTADATSVCLSVLISKYYEPQYSQIYPCWIFFFAILPYFEVEFRRLIKRG